MPGAQSDPRTAEIVQPPVPQPRADPRVCARSRGLPFRVCRWPESHDAPDERAGRGLHVRRAADGAGRADLDAVLSAPQSERCVFGGADVKGGGDVPDGHSAVPDRAHPADERSGGGRNAVAGRRPETARNAAPGRALRAEARLDILAGMRLSATFSFPAFSVERARLRATREG